LEWQPKRIDAVMHELSIALSLIETICDELPALGDVSVRSVRIRVGARAGVAADALAFAFDVAAAESAIAGAQLQIEATDGPELELTALEVVDAAADC
jgi:hydrogenase nickel incorporation protein HypA/HybF